jgi:hypothetical protein
MNNTIVRWSLLILACAQLGACQDRRDPAKPVVPTAAAQAPR